MLLLISDTKVKVDVPGPIELISAGGTVLRKMLEGSDEPEESLCVDDDVE